MSSSIELNSAEAFAAIALIAVAADGYITASESQAITTTFSRMQLFSDYSGEKMRAMIDQLLNQLQEQGSDVLLKAAVEKLPKELKETAFAVVTDITLADGEITEEEDSLLDNLFNVLEISEEMANNIIDVMLIKNKG
ncbi:MAG: tellurite resistance TerB family protein [Planktothrix sp.]|uniref:tellurite resistance TerB family protein n=1 Tax=Planktothrix sp. TaxID=3088171 RepID=UPI0038D35FF6